MNGLAIDAVTLQQATEALWNAKEERKPYLLSTPNVNFLVNCQKNTEFHDAVLNSDLCIADGMPLIWIARLLGVPLPERVAGSDLFEQLKVGDVNQRQPMSVFFFGGEEGVGERACDNLNTQSNCVSCTGFLDPGFVSLEEMSSAENIAKVNAAKADFLVAALGAVKGHIWLERNKGKIKTPLRSHLGAVINFEAGGVVRSPTLISRLGFEWLWRIKEEPKLWRRYWNDGVALLMMIITKILPLAIWGVFKRWQNKNRLTMRKISGERRDAVAHIHLSGHIDDEALEELRDCLKKVTIFQTDITLDLNGLEYMSASTLGLLIVMRKQLLRSKVRLRIMGVSKNAQRMFKWNGLSFMLENQEKPL